MFSVHGVHEFHVREQNNPAHSRTQLCGHSHLFSELCEPFCKNLQFLAEVT
jgi:hypothetical protein